MKYLSHTPLHYQHAARHARSIPGDIFPPNSSYISTRVQNCLMVLHA